MCTHVPGHALPPEVLSRVFEYVKIYSNIIVGDPRFHCVDWRQSCRFSTTAWIGITRVCRYWRDVAISHSTLWADISTESNEPWDISLQRARSFPLSIVAAIPRDPRSNALSAADAEYNQLIGEHLHHTRNLLFKTSAPDILTSLTSDTTSKPDLLVLHLRLTPDPIRAIQVLVPSFLESAPALQEISLEGFLLPCRWNAILPNLRILKLDTSCPCDTDRILWCLQHTLQLEELSLSVRVPSTQASILSNDEIIALPHLKEIVINDAAQACFDIWHPIRAHPHADISIWATDSSMPPEAQIQGSMATLSVHLKSPKCLTYTKVTVAGLLNFHRFEILIMEAALPPETIGRKRNGFNKITLGLELGGSHLLLQNILTATLCSKMPLHHTEEFRFFGIHHLTTESCTMLLSAIEFVKTIILDEVSSSTIEVFCSAMTRTKSSEASSTCAVPYLDSLDFAYLVLNSQSNAETVLSPLVQMLKARKEALHALQVLRIRCCTISEAQVEELRQIVPRVQWDGECSGMRH